MTICSPKFCTGYEAFQLLPEVRLKNAWIGAVLLRSTHLTMMHMLSKQCTILAVHGLHCNQSDCQHTLSGYFFLFVFLFVYMVQCREDIGVRQ